MITFLVAILTLVLGYFIYGKFIERFFGADDSIETPAIRLKDDVDFIVMPTWKMFTIQFLNIAGLGPIFGAILGAMYGPIAYIWIVFGCIFMGATHDYFSGMLSIRNSGSSFPEIVGKYLGTGFQNFLRIFTILLLVLVGVAFVTGPAGLLKDLTGGGFYFWLYGIFTYYLVATLLPINKIIGKIYPIFGAALLIMAVTIAGTMIFKSIDGSLHMNEINFSQLKNLHSNPGQNILYPMMFIVISCGAISGFHSTQSPMMARCMKKESYGRPVFFGAMIAEGIVAIIWATAAMNFFGDTHSLNETITSGHNPAWVVNEICNTWLGKIGAIFAIIGVIACPITTGDTAFRSARLTIADMLNIKQVSIRSRLLVSLPLFAVGFSLSQLEFSTIWKYLGLANQILSMIMLWTGAMYLAKKNKFHYVLSLPASFMTAICFTYLLVAPIKNGGLNINTQYGILIGILIALVAFSLFQLSIKKKYKTQKLRI
ncbi:carbon starvation protein A [Ancylomarina euxinus]|uniref:Carbon starvation protein A n=1 Tax=Ancylomarina euxinus TaxID=2283627 RepID=A0A425Y740_9BACT|nr:carbon starvation CstA family protein [Ancylomarina euxinus]MCZ4693956.1 carbon starvation protein A [Ancylomarina euxinus]MUP14623.1 carbon starvation protein A [Ancylomarina euxinus]RRG24170.1 carbon starvation protein A [Ancylomarina euxinus]